MKRFWVWIAATFAAGILLAENSAYPTGAIALVLMIAAVCIALIGRHIIYRQQIALTLAFVGMGMVYAELLEPLPQADPLFAWCQSQIAKGENLAQLPPVVIEGTIEYSDIVLPETEYTAFVVKVDRFEAQGKTFPISSRVRVTWSDPDYPVYAGQRVRVEGAIKNRIGTVNFGLQGIEPYYHRQSVYTSMNVASWGGFKVLEESSRSLFHWTARFRQAEAMALRDVVPASALPFVNMVWLGAGQGISHDEFQKYIQTGTAHVLSVSGIHVSIIYITLSLFLAIGLKNRKHRAALIIIAIWIFVMMSGLRVASVRSGMMITLFLAAELFDREPDAPTTLGQSAFLFLFLQPMLLFDLGFLLSFGSIASLLIFNPILMNSGFINRPWWLRENLASLFSVQLLTFPLVTMFFHVFPLFAALLNLLVIPLVGAVLWLCMITTLLAFMVPPIAPLFGHAIEPLVWLVDFLAEQGARLPGAYMSVTAPTAWAVAFFWLGVFAAAHALRTQKKPRRYAVLSVSALILCAILWHPNAEPGVDFLDVGHGDAAFIRTPGGTTMLIDGGDRSEYVDYGERVVVPFLFHQGVTHLDYLVMTHPDRDHVGGLLHTLESIPVGMAILPAIPSDRELEKELLQLCEQHHVAVQRCGRGDAIQVKGGNVEVLAPQVEHKFSDVNNNSLVLRVRWPGLDALFTGDIEKEAEDLLIQNECSAQILKVPHHGSHTSSTQAFLEAVKPSIAVVSTQSSTQRDAVHGDVLTRYGEMGIPLFRTDFSGGVRIRQDGGELVFQSARKFYGLDLSF